MLITLQSNYEGQIQTLLGYIESSTDALVVAGGGGTIMEVSRLQDKEKWINLLIQVVNGLIRRKEKVIFIMSLASYSATLFLLMFVKSV